MQGQTNHAVASKLREMADTLELQNADGYRVRAYLRAADTVDALDQPLDALFAEGGLKALDALPGIGRGIASAIAEMLWTGRWSKLERLQGLLEPERLFQTLPGIGPGLAAHIHEELDVDTLEGLEIAAHGGRLEKVARIGPRRAEAIRMALNERLGHRRVKPAGAVSAPAVSLLLDVDEEYRTKAAAGSLRKIAPKRFNPTGEAWLPVLHTQRDEWDFTVLFSNTQKAHDLRKTNDWVVIYFHTDGGPENQCTVVTETHGALTAHRVVRGRENECRSFYGP
jgi:DNA polymerase (family 10)